MDSPTVSKRYPFEVRAKLARNVYDAFLQKTDTFKYCGAHLAYLMGAILTDVPTQVNCVELLVDNPMDVLFMQYVMATCEAGTRVWDYINLSEVCTLDRPVVRCIFNRQHAMPRGVRCGTCGCSSGEKWGAILRSTK